jgi:hypothetical protein
MYDFCLLYKSESRDIVSMQIDDILILVDQSFAVVEDEAIVSAKIMIKTREQLNFEHFLKFNEIRIKRLELNIFCRQKTHIQDIQLINSIEFIIIINARDKIRMMLIFKKQYIAQRTRETYLISIVNQKRHLICLTLLSQQKSLQIT